MYNLSEKAIAEKYEDLLFTKVMALYAAEESEKILSEIENEEPADPKNIEKIYSKTERRENFSTLWKVSKKLITFAAMVVFVAVVSLSSVVVASAEAREAVAEAIYHLVLRKTDRYTEVSIGNSTGFIDPEIYDWEGAYAPTYIPEGFSISDTQFTNNDKSVMYSHGEDYFYISQTNNLSYARIDTEGSEHVEKIIIGNSEAFLVYENEIVSLVWICGETYLSIDGKISSDEAVKIAEGIKPIGKTEEPTEEYEFVDPEIYDWEGAYAPTYMPKEYILKEKSEMPNRKSVTYINGEKYVAISQSVDGVFQIDTEDADIYKKISINESDAVYVENKGFVFIVWSIGEKTFSVRGTINPKEALKIAESLKPIEKYEAPAEEYEFIDPEIYDWEGAYAPTYMPEGFEISDIDIAPDCPAVTYSKGKQFFVIYQLTEGAKARIDSENAEVYKTVFINGNEGLFIKKADEISITWNNGNIFFWLFGTISEKEFLKVAEGLKPLGKTETEDPAEEYEFVDPEIYTWDNAYGLTYITENYDFYSVKDLEISRIVNYMQGEKYISFVQYTDTTVATDTEDADITKEIQIGESKGFLVVKDDWSCVFYSVEDILLQVSGTAPTEEIIKVAEGIRPIN